MLRQVFLGLTQHAAPPDGAPRPTAINNAGTSNREPREDSHGGNDTPQRDCGRGCRRRGGNGWPAFNDLAEPRRSAARGKEASGLYRHKVGDYELTQISDGGTTFPLTDGFVTNADKAAVNAALEAAYMPKDQLTIIFNPMVVNTGSNLILIDTGYGAVGPKTAGQLQANMAAAGIDPKAIDIVVISHLHPDHINGLVGADGGIAFPNAEIKTPAPDVAFWMDDGMMSCAPEGRLLDYFKNVRRVMGVVSSKVTKYEWDKEVASGITAFATAGHTPGHTSFVIASGSGMAVGAVGRHQSSGAVRAQSGLVGRVRLGRTEGDRDPPQVLRHGCGGEVADCRLPLSIPLARPH